LVQGHKEKRLKLLEQAELWSRVKFGRCEGFEGRLGVKEIHWQKAKTHPLFVLTVVSAVFARHKRWVWVCCRSSWPSRSSGNGWKRQTSCA